MTGNPKDPQTTQSASSESADDIELAAYDLDGDGKISVLESERARLGLVDARLEEIAQRRGGLDHGRLHPVDADRLLVADIFLEADVDEIAAFTVRSGLEDPVRPVRRPDRPDRPGRAESRRQGRAARGPVGQVSSR